MKILFLGSLFLLFTACTTVKVDLPIQMLESPETTGKTWGFMLGGAVHTNTELDILNDSTATPPSSSGSSVQLGSPSIGLTSALGIIPRLDIGVSQGFNESPGFFSVKYNFLGGLNQPGWVFTTVVLGSSFSSTQDANSILGSTSAHSKVSMSGLGYELMAGYKFDPVMGFYLTYSHINYHSSTDVDQTTGGATTSYNYSDGGLQTISGIGFFRHTEHFNFVSEWTCAKVHWPRLTSDPYQCGVGMNAGYIF